MQQIGAKQIMRLIHALLAFVFCSGVATCLAQDRDVVWPDRDWPRALPANHGIDLPALSDLENRLRVDMPNVRSLLLVRQGYLVFEYYGENSQASQLHYIASVTKSVTAALIGVAQQRGLLSEVSDTIGQHMALPMRSEIRVVDLLTMTAGFQWDEQASDLCARREISKRQVCPGFNPDQSLIEFALNRPMERRPGSTFNYDSYSSHILSALLVSVSNGSTSKFAEQTLFRSLDIKDYRWEVDRNQMTFGGRGLHLRPVDMAKLGLLYLRGGKWKGEQILHPNFAKDSVRGQSAGGRPLNTEYGYSWWISKTSGDRDMFFAAGYGGQYIYVVPSLDLVAVVTTKQRSSDDVWQLRFGQLVTSLVK